MAHTTLSVLTSPNFPQTFIQSIDAQIRRVTEIYDRNMNRGDFEVENHGSIFLLRPISEGAHDWAFENLPADVPTFGTAIAVEHRFIADIVEGIQSAGLEVR